MGGGGSKAAKKVHPDEPDGPTMTATELPTAADAAPSSAPQPKKTMMEKAKEMYSFVSKKD